MPIYRTEKTLGGGYRTFRSSAEYEVGSAVGTAAGWAVGGGIQLGAKAARTMQERRMIKILQDTLGARDSGDPTKFLAAAKNCVRKVPGQDISHILMGQALMVNGRYDEAIRSIDYALSLGSWDEGEAASARAEVYMYAEDYRAALQELTRLANYPEYRAEALCGRAICMLQFDDKEQALKDANEAVAADPRDITYHLRSMVQASRNDFTSALADLDRAINIGGGVDSDDLEFRANLLDELGRSDEAKDDRLRAAAIRDAPVATTPRGQPTSAGPMPTANDSAPGSPAVPPRTSTSAPGPRNTRLRVLGGIALLVIAALTAWSLRDAGTTSPPDTAATSPVNEEPNKTDNWQTPVAPSAAQDYLSPEYGWEASENCRFAEDGYHVTGDAGTCNSSINFVDGDITVTVKTLTGGLAGISFRRNGPYMYFLQILPTSEWSVNSSNGNETRPITPLRKSSAIATGVGAENVLRVHAAGAHFQLYANGVKLGEAEDEFYRDGAVGLFGYRLMSNANEVVFSNLTIARAP